MARHMPGTVWLLRKIGSYPQVYVKTVSPERIEIISINREDDGLGMGFEMDRRSARLLAKRINQCLDATRSK